MLKPYQGGLSAEERVTTDALLVQWWAQLAATGELTSTFGRGSLALSEFYHLLTDRDRLFLFDTDDVGIALCLLVTPLMGGAFLTLWVEPRHRQSKSMLITIEDAYSRLFAAYPVILGVTRQEKLLPVHHHWGYTILGKVPALFDGEDAWIVMLTKDAFEARRKVVPS